VRKRFSHESATTCPCLHVCGPEAGFRAEASTRKAGPWFLEGTVQPHAHSIHQPRISRLAHTCLSIISSQYRHVHLLQFSKTLLLSQIFSAISAIDLGRNPAPLHHHFYTKCTCYTSSFPTNLNVTLETRPTGIHPSSQSRNLPIHSFIEATLSPTQDAHEVCNGVLCILRSAHLSVSMPHNTIKSHSGV
jgi:hypothetical protein